MVARGQVLAFVADEDEAAVGDLGVDQRATEPVGPVGEGSGDHACRLCFGAPCVDVFGDAVDPTSRFDVGQQPLLHNVAVPQGEVNVAWVVGQRAVGDGPWTVGGHQPVVAAA